MTSEVRHKRGETSVERAESFSEKGFYLREFHGRTIGLALPGPLSSAEAKPLQSILAELAANETHVVILTPSDVGTRRSDAQIPRVEFASDERDWTSRVWRAFAGSACVQVEISANDAFPVAVRVAVGRMRLAKLVWLDPCGPIPAPSGERVSFVALEQLGEFAERPGLAPKLAPVLREIRAMLDAGLPSVSLCSADGLAGELFSYAGSGTFFARERYTAVRRLAIDEFDAADALMTRGVEEGYLAPRPPDERDAILAHAFGVFVEGRFLAGIGALLPHPEARAGEVASLYTLTRFVGEGVGQHLVNFARERASELGFDFVFACTTSERVERFFVRQGFRIVDASELPESKWRAYPPERRAKLRCLASDL